MINSSVFDHVYLLESYGLNGTLIIYIFMQVKFSVLLGLSTIYVDPVYSNNAVVLLLDCE